MADQQQPAKTTTPAAPATPAKSDSKLLRVVLGLPLLGLFFAAPRVFQGESAVPYVVEALKRPAFAVGSANVPILRSFYGVAGLDQTITFLNQFFLPAIYGNDSVGRAQLFSFLTDLSVPIAIWTIEAARRANRWSVLQLPVIFLTLGQLRGIGWFGPLYFYVHMVTSPTSLLTPSGRRTKLPLVWATLPAVLLAHVLPGAAMFLSRDLPARQAWLYVWQIFPVTLVLGQRVVSWLFPSPTSPSPTDDQEEAKADDLTAIRTTILPLVLLSSGVWLYTLFGRWPGHNGLDVLAGVFFPKRFPGRTTDLTGFAREFLRCDEGLAFGAGLLWLGYLFWDLNAASLLQESWLTVGLRAGAVLVALGPGATLGLGWLWREEVLARRK